MPIFPFPAPFSIWIIHDVLEGGFILGQFLWGWNYSGCCGWFYLDHWSLWCCLSKNIGHDVDPVGLISKHLFLLLLFFLSHTFINLFINSFLHCLIILFYWLELILTPLFYFSLMFLAPLPEFLFLVLAQILVLRLCMPTEMHTRSTDYVLWPKTCGVCVIDLSLQTFVILVWLLF